MNSETLLGAALLLTAAGGTFLWLLKRALDKRFRQLETTIHDLVSETRVNRDGLEARLRAVTICSNLIQNLDQEVHRQRDLETQHTAASVADPLLDNVDHLVRNVRELRAYCRQHSGTFGRKFRSARHSFELAFSVYRKQLAIRARSAGHPPSIGQASEKLNELTRLLRRRKAELEIRIEHASRRAAGVDVPRRHRAAR
jgi:hypothetical protein